MNHRRGEDQAQPSDDATPMLTDSLLLIETFILSGVAGASLLLVREMRVLRYR